MVPFFSRLIGKPNLRHFLAIDIGSATTIRSLSLEVDALGRDPRVLSKRQVRLPARAGTPRLILAMRERLRHLIFWFLRELGRVPEGVIVGLGSHFTLNFTERAAYERPEPQRPVTGEELGVFLAQHLERRKVQRIGTETYRLAVSTPLGLEIDGYPTETLSRSSRGRAVTIGLVNTYVQDGFWAELQGLSSFLGGLDITFISNQSAIAEAVLGVLNLSEALMVKVGAAITEVTLLKSGRITSAGQFPSGGNDVTLEISSELSLPFAEAERLKQELGVARTSPDTRGRVEGAIQRAVKRWLDEFVGHLSQDEALTLPETVFLLGGGAKLDALKQALESQPWFSHLTLLPRLAIVRLEARDIIKNLFPNIPPPLSGPEEVALSSLVNRLLRGPKLVVSGPLCPVLQLRRL